jgi:uncharacterized protein
MSEIQYANDPTRLPDWQELAQGRPFYSGARWLSFADTDRLARSHYLAVPGTAALSAHWTPEEVNGGYLPSRLLPGVGEGPELTLGGRRGYLSAPLTGGGAGAEKSLASLVHAALEREPQANGRWWWPYLTGQDAAHVLRATHGTWAAGVHLVSADCVLDVPQGGLEEYLAALPSTQRRTHVRREIHRYGSSGLRTVRDRLAPWAGALGALLSNVQRKYGHDHSPEQMADLLRRQAQHLDADSVVFLALDPDAPDRPVGFSLAYRHGPELAVRVVGFDYERLRGADEYAELTVHAPVRYCQQNGLRRLHLGKGSYQAKCRRGAQVRPLWAVSALGGAGTPEAVPEAALPPGLLDRDARALRTRADDELAALGALLR